jgi:hypothetical protein
MECAFAALLARSGKISLASIQAESNLSGKRLMMCWAAPMHGKMWIGQLLTAPIVYTMKLILCKCKSDPLMSPAPHFTNASNA